MAADPIIPPKGEQDAAASLDWVRQAGRAEEVRAVVRHQLRRRRITRATLALLLVTVAGLGVGGLRFVSTHTRPLGETELARQTYAEAGRYVLADGSVMDLRAGSVVEMDWDSHERGIRLNQGQAFFQVREDAHRPFVVRAQGTEARDVGTAYAVALTEGRVEVLVIEGSVALKPEAALPARLIAAGQHGRIDLGSGSRAVVIGDSGAEEIALTLAWRSPRLEFDGTPLREVLAEFNRYNVTKLTLEDESLGDLPVSGLLRADNAPVLLTILDRSYGIVVRRNGDNLGLVRRSP